jgi:hypothetical protein
MAAGGSETVGEWSYTHDMPRGNPAAKMAITVDADVHRRVLEEAERAGQSVSAWMTDAARHALRRVDGLATVRQWEAEHGAFTEDELSDARRFNAVVEREMGWHD